MLKEMIAFSDEIEVTTLSSRSGYYSYATLKVGVVIYTNTTRGGITESQIASIKKGLDLGKLFYWRNSKMKLNVEYDYIRKIRAVVDPINRFYTTRMPGRASWL